MAIPWEQPGGPVEDSRFQEGMSFLQAGRWHEAIRCFEGLLAAFPDHPTAQQALSQARLKAKLEAGRRIRAKRWNIPWRLILVRTIITLGTVAVVVMSLRFLQQQVAPLLGEWRERRTLADLEADGNAFLEGGKLDRAEANFNELLAAVPGHEGAQEGLRLIAQEREVMEFYRQAVNFQEGGDREAALRLYTEVLVRRPRYKDVSLRIQEIKWQQSLDDLYAAAEADYAAGYAADAVPKYEQLRAMDVSYKREQVVRRLIELHLELGRGLVEQDPPASDNVPLALDHFVAALSLDPRNGEVALELEVARLFLEGQEAHERRDWDAAIHRLAALEDRRPGYLGGLGVALLYDAYLRSGDSIREDDCTLAYLRYSEAAALAVDDRAVALARLSQVKPCMTPTPTPTITPTPTPLPTATPWPTWTPIPPPPSPTPTPTPWLLAALHNKILFISRCDSGAAAGQGEESSLWVMDPSGANRRYIGRYERYESQVEAIREKERFSPDGRYRVYVTAAQQSPQLWLELPPHDQYGPLPPRQITFLTGLSYDPVWAPDGGRIAFVSQENGSDDIWLVNPDGSDIRWINRNVWEWDKHPSWSPDSSRIVFWSNRSGLKQIYIMDAEGRNVTKISSSSSCDEYDPTWVK